MGLTSVLRVRGCFSLLALALGLSQVQDNRTVPVTIGDLDFAAGICCFDIWI